MASRKELLRVTYHYDTDTGIYEIGEVDFGISGELDDYIRCYGRNGINSIVQTLAHLIWHVKEYGGRIVKDNVAKGVDNNEPI